MSLPDFKTSRVTVVGDLMLDRYWSGHAGRISPEAPVPVVKVSSNDDRLGGAANVAANCAALGCQAKLIGWVGQDDAGRRVKQLLRLAKVKAHVSATKSMRTITKLRVLAQQQQLIRLDFEDKANQKSKDISPTQLDPYLGSSDVLVISDYGKGAIRYGERLIELGRRAQLPVLVDPKGLDFGRYRGATLLKPNFQEFQAVVGTCGDEATIVSKANNLMRQHDLGSILITRGSKGMTWVSKSSSVHIPVKSQDVFDVTGAGDTVIATVAACLGAGSTLLDAIHWANLAASIAVSKVGTSTVTAAELTKKGMVCHSTTSKIFATKKDLAPAWSQWRSAGEKIVMTNGVFDLLHAGHVEYLERARSLGDRLVVAVNGNASTRKLKGPSRPIVSLENRMRLLAALSCVDAVISFDAQTPERLYADLLPDFLVKGGDYQVQQIAGARAVQAAGGQVRLMPFKEGFASTQIINRILSQGAV